MKFLSDKDALIQLGKQIVALRKEHNLSYQADIDLSTISRLERGGLNVSYITLYKIAQGFNISVKDLFDF